MFLYLFGELGAEPADCLYLKHHGGRDDEDLYNLDKFPT
jgi:hypothetical protein